MRSALLVLSLIVVPTAAHASPSPETRAWWGIVRESQDIRGNRDGIWENEDLEAGERGWFRGGVESPSKNELAAWKTWRDAQVGSGRVTSTNSDVIDGVAANAMARYGRTRTEFADGFTNGVYTQRWDAKETGARTRGSIEQKIVTVIVPGYTESTSDWMHVANRMNEAGSRVYVFDPPGQGMSAGRRGDVKDMSEWTNAYRDVLAKAQAENPGAKVVVLGHSTGGGVLLGDAHDRVNGQVHTKGPDGMVLSAPYLEMRPNVLNKVSGILSKVPFANGLQVPPLIKLSDDALGSARLKQWQQATGAKQTLHFIDALSKLGKTYDEWLDGQTGITIPVGLVQGVDDNVTNPAASKKFIANTPGARMVTVDTGSHDLQHDAAGVEALLGEWERVVGATLGNNAGRDASTRPAGTSSSRSGAGASDSAGQDR